MNSGSSTNSSESRAQFVSYIRNFGSALTSSQLTENKESKLFKVLKSLGLAQEQISTYILVIQPAIEEVIQNAITKVLTVDDFRALIKVGKERNFDEEHMLELFDAAYEDKAGKAISTVVDQFLDGLAETIESSINDAVDITEKSEDAQNPDEAFNKLLEDKINSYLDSIL